MLDDLLTAYRDHIARGESPGEASRAAADAVAINAAALPEAFRELAAAALPFLGRVQRQRALALSPGKPWYERAELQSWLRIPVPVGNTGRRALGAEIGKAEARTIGQFLTRHGMTAVKRGRAFTGAAEAMKNGQKLPDVLSKLPKEHQRVIGEYILSFRAAVA